MLDEYQQKAAEHLNGPCLCIAGPGSGKTTTVVQRVINIVNAGNDPTRILVVTFTKAAAESMFEKYKAQVGTDYDADKCPHFCTIHSYAFAMNKFAYGLDKEHVIDSSEEITWIINYLQQSELQLEYRDISKAAKNIASEISKYMISIDPEHFIPAFFSDPEEFFTLFRAYQTYKAQNNKQDYDDMIRNCHDLLRDRQDYRDKYCAQYDYIMVDEFQDTDPIQADIIYTIALPKNNIFICGDDDQSIYKFRGACPQLMKDFQIRFPNCYVSHLSINYRSDKSIVKVAKKLIENNNDRFDKSIMGQSKLLGKVKVKYALSSGQELKQMSLDLCDKNRKYNYEDTAILCRTNAQINAVVKYLSDNNLPFIARNGVENFYNMAPVHIMLSYLKLVYQRGTDDDFFYILNKPMRYIGKTLIINAHGSKEEFEKLIAHDGRCRGIYEKLNNKLSKVSKEVKAVPLNQSLNYIIDSFHLNRAFVEFCDYRHLDIDDFLETIETLKDDIAEYTNIDEYLAHVEESAKKLAENLKKHESDTSKITVSTMHNAKGLEWDYVCIPFADEGACPYINDHITISKDYIEEERRLFYVAITRARHQVSIYTNQDIYQMSRFVRNMLD